MLKLYIALLLALIWVLLVVKTADSADILACYENPLPSPDLPLKTTILDMVRIAGFDPVIADKIVNCESGWKTTATHLNQNGTRDIGLWQLNDVHGLSVEERMDPYLSTIYAIKLMQSSRSYSHWVCYR